MPDLPLEYKQLSFVFHQIFHSIIQDTVFAAILSSQDSVRLCIICGSYLFLMFSHLLLFFWDESECETWLCILGQC